MMATSAPEAANRFAMASPIPLLAPVMTAVLPARLTSIRILPLAPEHRARPLTSYSPGRGRESGGGRQPAGMLERRIRRAAAGARGRVVSNARLPWSTTMEFTALFLAVAVVMVVAW